MYHLGDRYKIRGKDIWISLKSCGHDFWVVGLRIDGAPEIEAVVHGTQMDVLLSGLTPVRPEREGT